MGARRRWSRWVAGAWVAALGGVGCARGGQRVGVEPGADAGGVVADGALGVPAPPTDLRLGAATGTSIRVLWTDASGDATRFVVRYRRVRTEVWTTVERGADATDATATGLATGGRYGFRVRACNAAGCSAETPELLAGAYPWHRDVTATVFWAGEPAGGGATMASFHSTWDDYWLERFNRCAAFDRCATSTTARPPDADHVERALRDGYHPRWTPARLPAENPFYFGLPYDDLRDGARRAGATTVVYADWVGDAAWGPADSMLKNRWAAVSRGGTTCYAQWEDSGPYGDADGAYVFGDGGAAPANAQSNGAGLNVSPALRDCLGFPGENDDANRVDWQFIEFDTVPPGPWREVVTASPVCFQSRGCARP